MRVMVMVRVAVMGRVTVVVRVTVMVIMTHGYGEGYADGEGYRDGTGVMAVVTSVGWHRAPQDHPKDCDDYVRADLAARDTLLSPSGPSMRDSSEGGEEECSVPSRPLAPLCSTSHAI